MAISQHKAIIRLYNEVLANGIIVDENKSIDEITKSCEKKGQFIFRGDSYWSFVQTKIDGRKCIRMIFTLKENSGGKVHNIDRIIELIGNIERTLIFIDKIKIVKAGGFIYLDAHKHTS